MVEHVVGVILGLWFLVAVWIGQWSPGLASCIFFGVPVVALFGLLLVALKVAKWAIFAAIEYLDVSPERQNAHVTSSEAITELPRDV